VCEFLSAIKTKSKTGRDKWYFLTHDLIHNTPRGEIIQKKYKGDGELIGHSAIREYFELRSGTGENWECSDFSTPDNFPTVIVKALKRGEFKGFNVPAGLLLQTKRDAIDKEYQPKQDAIYKEYQTKRDAIDKEYQPKQDAIDKEYQDSLWDLFAIPENRVEVWR
jgi:hypothetical protein